MGKLSINLLQKRGESKERLQEEGGLVAGW